MKIYTKKGDAGITDLIKQRVKKSDLRIEFNGTIDELNAFISYGKIYIKDENILNLLDEIIKKNSLAMYEIAANETFILDSDVLFLEKKIDFYQEKLVPLTKFIYFDENKGASILNIARTITRKAERVLVLIAEGSKTNQELLKYLNRLSDLLFVLARKLEGK